MRSWDALPKVSLTPAGPLSTEFIALGITDLQAVGRYLQMLPYGRTADRANFQSVLRQAKGTCSTKHALLAALADEQELPHEESIIPEQIGDYKVAMHRQFLQDWVLNHPEMTAGMGFEQLWQVREACIAVLAQ